MVFHWNPNFWDKERILSFLREILKTKEENFRWKFNIQYQRKMFNSRFLVHSHFFRIHTDLKCQCLKTTPKILPKTDPEQISEGKITFFLIFQSLKNFVWRGPQKSFPHRLKSTYSTHSWNKKRVLCFQWDKWVCSDQRMF